MKLDTSHMRYLSKHDFRVLTAIEMGSKNHSIVPTKLIVSISGLRSEGQVQKSISALAKIKLITRDPNAKYDGYRLTYHGYDYLALKAMVARGSVYAVGTQIGIGKESDIFTATNDEKAELCLKVHRLGRISFRAVKNQRDYLGKRQSASWIYLSRLAAQKEYAFMQTLYENGFSVPQPIDNSRHHVLMSLIDGVLLRKLDDHPDPARLYSCMMDFIMRLANHGLIHCDFNEFNVMVCEYNEAEPDKEIVVIDFPQCVSIDHKDAKEYFERDVNSVRHFFSAHFNHEGEYPEWEDVKRIATLDAAADASGADKKALKELEKHFQLVGETEEPSGNESDQSDEELGDELGESEVEDNEDQ